MGNVTEEEHVQDETVFKVQVKLYIPAMSLDISTEVTGERRDHVGRLRQRWW